MAITPAMPTGSGLTQLMERYPKRCLDVGIAEQHAVTLAAGMATGDFAFLCDLLPLQRAYDQVMHDVACKISCCFLIIPVWWATTAPLIKGYTILHF